jgi:heme oxygenase
MSLKELTKDSHTAAEHTPFMQAVFKKRMPVKTWGDYTFQKSAIYNTIENVCRYNKLTNDILDIERSVHLYLDAQEIMGDMSAVRMRPITGEYVRYLLSLVDEPERILAHLYVWHMGDLHGGQMIKKVLPPPHRNLDFADVEGLKVAIRAKLNDSMADEANIAFEWAMKLMNTYDADFV